MTDRQLDPEQEVEIAQERVRPEGEPPPSASTPDVRQTPAEPTEGDVRESTEFDRQREAGRSQ